MKKKELAMLEAIDPNAEFAYKKAFLAYVTVKQLPVFIFNIASGMEVC